MAVCVALGAGVMPAQAFDFFGLFGERPPAVRPDALPYVVTFETDGKNSIESVLKDASSLYRLRDDAPADAGTLVRRAIGDLSPLTDALWGDGYHDGAIEIVVAGQVLRFGAAGQEAAQRAAETYRNRAPVPVVIRAIPGERFRLRDVNIIAGAGLRPGGPGRAPGFAGLNPGDPARAPDLRAAQARVVDDYRAQSRPLARGGDISIVVDHPAKAVDATIPIISGPVAPIGQIGLGGTQAVDPRVVRSFIYAQPGYPYSPQALADIRKSVARIPALGSVRVRQADTLAPDGSLPLFVEVTERPPRVVGVSARYSTLDGPALHAYWGHRNLLGGAEELRIEGETFLLPRPDGGATPAFGDLDISDLGGRLRTTFVKPALGGSRNDLLAGSLIERDRTGGNRYGGYTSRSVEVTAGIRHRFSDRFSIQGGLEYERGQTSDSLGIVDYRLLGVPLSLTYDSTDNPLNATRGWKVTAAVTPYIDGLGSSVGFVESRLGASTYFALDEEARYVLAARLGLGSAAGADLADIPANHRFYAGGGGSVRGYLNRSLAPLGPTGQVIGGRSLIEGSLEARIKVTDTIGIVPFVDAGGAFESEYPDFEEKLRVAAGIGLRYYTAIGPIRLDVAAPLNRRAGDRPVAIYVSIGQAF